MVEHVGSQAVNERAPPLAIAVGISVSESPDMAVLGLGVEHLQDAVVEVARYLLASNANLVFGGDLRPGTFTELLFELVTRHWRDAESSGGRSPIVNCIAWPESLAWAASRSQTIDGEWAGLVDLQLLDQDGRALDLDESPSAPAAAVAPEDASTALTAMRKRLVKVTNARVFLGGGADAHSGAISGVAEECLIALEAEQPVFLLGGFGGCTRDIACELGLLPHDMGRKSSWSGRTRFSGFEATHLRNGLSPQDNQRLAHTVHIDEAVLLILRGLAHIRQTANFRADAAERMISQAWKLAYSGDRRAAFEALGALIADTGANTDQVAEALILRSELRGDDDAAGEMADLDAAVALPGLSAVPLSRTLFRRARIQERNGAEDAAIADYSALIDLPDATSEQREEALLNRGILRMNGDRTGAMADYSASMALSGPRSGVRMTRILARENCGDWEGLIADCSAVIRREDNNSEDLQRAFDRRGTARAKTGDMEGAIEDYTAVVEIPDSEGYLADSARQSRDAISGGTWVSDVNSAEIERPGVCPQDLSRALLGRAVERARRGRREAAIRDFAAVINLADAPVEVVVEARLGRGALSTDPVAEMADYTAVLDLAEASADDRAKALVTRGTARLRLGDVEAALEDCAAITRLPDVSPASLAQATALRLTVTLERVDTPTDERAQALNRRAAARMMLDDRRGAIADYSRVVAMESAPVEQRALALNNRGFAKAVSAAAFADACADYWAVARLDQCPADYVAVAMFNLMSAEVSLPDQARDHTEGQPSTLFVKALGLHSGEGDPDAETDVAAAIRALVGRLVGSGLRHRLAEADALANSIAVQSSSDAGLAGQGLADPPRDDGELSDSERQRRRHSDSPELLRVLLGRDEALRTDITPPPERFQR